MGATICNLLTGTLPYPMILFAAPDETELGRTGYIAGGPEAFFKLFEEWRGKFEKGKDQPKVP